MRFVGRDEELAAILRLAEAPLEQALLLVGEPGAGKSRLLEEAYGRSPIRCVLTHAPPTEDGAELLNLARLFAFVDDSCSAALAAAARARVAPSEWLEPVRTLVARRRAHPHEPLMVLIDDVDRLDDACQRVLAFFAEGLAGTGIRLVATATTHLVPTRSPLASFRRAEVPALDAVDSRALASLALGPGADPVDLDLLVDAAQGLPEAIVDYASASRGSAPVLPHRPGASQHRLRSTLLDGADPATVRLLELISLAPATHVAAIAQEPPGPDLLDDLRRGGLLASDGQHVRVADARLRSALVWGMDSAERRNHHRQLSALHRGIDDRLALWHTSHGESAAQSGPSHSTSELLEFAREFVSAGRVAVGVEFAERARACGPAATDTGRVAELAEALLLGEELDLAQRYLTVAGSLGDPRARTHLETLRVALAFRRTGTISDIDVDAVLAVSGADASPEAVRLNALAALCHALRWEVDVARERLGAARRDLLLSERSPTDESEPAEAADMHDLDRQDLNELRALLDAIDDLVAAVDSAPTTGVPSASTGARPSRPELLLLRAATLMYRERYTEARRTLAMLLAQPNPLAPLWAAVAARLRERAEIRSGALHRVGHELLRWRAGGEAATSTIDATAERALSERNPAVAGETLAALGAAALADGHVDEAIRLLEVAEAMGERFANPALLRHSIDLVEAYVLAGRTREARSILDALDAAAQRHPSRWALIALARGRALIAPDDRSLALYLRALELFGPEDSPFDHGRTLVHLAFAQARLGFPRESEKSLAAARNAFASAGVPGWATRMQRGRAVAHPHQTSTVGVLTEEERLIVEKVREGYRNKEIAAALYISLRTVELRLTHIYRKVGARSRSHLAALLG